MGALTLTSDELRALGRAIYGDTWQTSLSRDLEVSDRTVRRWAAGESIPPGVVADLIELAEGRAEVLAMMARHLRKAYLTPSAG